MKVIRLNWSKINHVTTNLSLDRILSKYPVVFKNELELLKGTKDSYLLPCVEYQVVRCSPNWIYNMPTYRLNSNLLPLMSFFLNMLPFCIASASSIFQQAMDSVYKDYHMYQLI